MEEKREHPVSVSEADLLSEDDMQEFGQSAPEEEKTAEELSEDEIITFGVNDDKKKKSKFLEDKVDGTSQQLSADNYDIDIPTPQPENADARIAGKTPVRVFYDMNGEEVSEGMKRFHQLTMYGKNLAYTIILAVIFSLYVYRIASAASTDSMQYFLAAVCVAMIAFIWYMPHRHIKATREAVEKEKTTFMVDVYDTCIMVGNEGNQSMIDFDMSKPRVIAFETPLNFCIGVGREKIFIIPKRCTEGREEAVRASLTGRIQR